ncbi:hypothetical protein QR77_31785 [Streptomyces sp. 150FB]|uniref:DUF6629 family protein n=1 Tax=Streptomyces sp. 150FB TaxID=1576605 RepID=UPI0005896BAA|nr:DUF6629 family protein [Streptomyces sp. 150FB]KIF77205.1 hypothetical protein QR77_31785 [Streptomyces sp. 150FB]
MCWSATADLVAGTGIAAIGVACVVRLRRARDLPLAALPLLLGAHQIVESVIWRSDGGSGPATVVWAAIALPLLALWVPLGVACAVPLHTRRWLLVPLVAGAATATVLAYCLAVRPVRAEVRGHTLGYAVDVPLPGLVVAGYLLATVGSLLLAGDRRLTLLGVLTGAGAVICVAVWRAEFISTWCAVAAVCSVVLFGWAGRRPLPAPGGASPSSVDRTGT